MDVRRRQWLMGMCLAFVLAALAMLWLRRSIPQGPAEDAPTPMATPRTVGSAAGPPDADAGTDAEVDTCPEARAALAAVEQRVPTACEAELLGDGCQPPLPYSPLSWAPERQRELVEEVLASCPDVPEGAVRMDCSEYPCFVLVHRGEVEAPSCRGMEMVAAIDPEQWTDPTGSEWVVFPQITPREQLTSDAAPIAARSDIRKRRVARWLADPESPQLATERSCAEVEALLAAARSGSPCDAARAVWGCEPVEEPVDREVAQRHLDAAREQVHALADRCSELAERPFVVDCTDLPCLLAIDAEGFGGFDRRNPQASPVGDALCGDLLVRHYDTMTAQGHPRSSCGMVAIIPLWDAGGLREAAPAVEERYFTTRDFRKNRACHRVEAVRP